MFTLENALEMSRKKVDPHDIITVLFESDNGRALLVILRSQQSAALLGPVLGAAMKECPKRLLVRSQNLFAIGAKSDLPTLVRECRAQKIPYVCGLLSCGPTVLLMDELVTPKLCAKLKARGCVI